MPVRRARERARRCIGVGRVGVDADVGLGAGVVGVGLGGVDDGNAGRSFKRRSNALIVWVSERRDAFGASPRGSMGVMVVSGVFRSGLEPAGDGVMIMSGEFGMSLPSWLSLRELSLARQIA